MRMLDLFSGIGGFALAATWVWQNELEIVSFCEKEEFPQKVLNKHWPDVPIEPDVKELHGYDYTDIDLLTGGFPCQPFSSAGQRRGTEDDRDLWPEMFRIIQESQPRWIIGENVAGFTQMALDRTLSDLEDEGYTTEPFIIPAVSVGARHRRDRVWVVGYSEQQRRNDRSDTQRQDRIYKKGQQDTESQQQRERFRSEFSKTGQIVVNTESKRVNGELGNNQEVSGKNRSRDDESDSSRQNLCDSTIQRFPDWAGGTVEQPRPLTEFGRSGSNGDIGEIERDFRGVSHGVSRRVDRIKGLGNAIVPQVAYEIMLAIQRIEAL